MSKDADGALRTTVHRPCPDYPLCSNVERGNITEFLNQKHVKEALKFPEAFVFDQVNWQINPIYTKTSGGKPTSPEAAAILDSYMTPKLVDDGKPIGDVRVLVLNGNEDPMVGTPGNMMQWDRVAWSRMAEYRGAQWHDLEDEGVAATGSWKATKDGRLAFVAVDKAGHMVPGDVPEGAYRILQRWIAGEWRS
jgi:cathepsin A (carboxypeptidase C)